MSEIKQIVNFLKKSYLQQSYQKKNLKIKTVTKDKNLNFLKNMII